MIINFLKYTLLISFKKHPLNNVLGVQNVVRTPEKDYFVTFLDYDNQNEKEIKKELEQLIEEFELSDFYVFKTDKGYHAYNLKLLPFNEMLKVVFSSNTDESHKTAPFRKKEEKAHTLRFTPKKQDITFSFIVDSGLTGLVAESKPHRKFLETYFNAPVKNNNNVLGENLEIVSYYQKF